MSRLSAVDSRDWNDSREQMPRKIPIVTDDAGEPIEILFLSRHYRADGPLYHSEPFYPALTA
jgi:hypothetical protein